MVDRGNRRYHDRVAGRYDQIYDSAYWRFYREVSWRHLKPHLPTHRPAHGADLGCGTGWFGVRLVKAGLHTVFLDPSPKMLEASRAALEAVGPRAVEARFLQGEMEDLRELADGSLDFATGQGDPLSFCADPRRALAELRRVLRPGAGLVLSVDNRVAGVRTLLDEPSPAAALELLRTGRTRWRAQRHEEAFGMKMFDRDELHGLLERAGFAVRSWIAKTCLVQRHNEAWLEDAEARRQLLDAEESVHGLPHWFGLAGHLQVAAVAR